MSDDLTHFERRAHRIAARCRLKDGRASDWVTEFAMQTHVSALKMALFSHIPVANRISAMVRATETLTSPDGEEQILVVKGSHRQVVIHMALRQENAPGGRILLAYWSRQVRDHMVPGMIDELWGFLETRSAVRHAQPGLPLDEIVLPS